MQETRVQSLGEEDPLEKEMATHSSTLAWEVPWTEEPDRLQSMGLQEPNMTEKLNNNKEKNNCVCTSYDFVPGQCKGNNGKHTPNDKIIL